MGDKMLRSKLMLMSKLLILGKALRKKFCFFADNAQITYPPPDPDSSPLKVLHLF